MNIFDKNKEGNNETKLGAIVIGGLIVMVSILCYTWIVLEGM